MVPLFSGYAPGAGRDSAGVTGGQTESETTRGGTCEHHITEDDADTEVGGAEREKLAFVLTFFQDDAQDVSASELTPRRQRHTIGDIAIRTGIPLRELKWGIPAQNGDSV